MPSRDKKICLFGDSHLPSLRYAIGENLVDLTGKDIEFFGAGGGHYHQLSMADDGVLTVSEKSREHVQMISGSERASLAAEDFDGFLFHGIRLRSSKLLVELLHRMNANADYISAAVRRRALVSWLESRPGVHWASRFAQHNGTKVAISPAPFETQARGASYQGVWMQAQSATKEQRAEVNHEIATILKSKGVAFVPQPEETIVDGCFTDDRFAGRVETADGHTYQDTCHMNGAYGAIVLTAGLNALG